MAHPDLSAEQAHVDHAYDRLADLRTSATERLVEAFEEKGGTFQAVTERDIRVRNNLGRLEQLEIGGEALVFGRIDRRSEITVDDATSGSTLRTGLDPTVEAFHIGRLAVADVNLDPLVVDWRAPVAEPFYRATGAHPMDLVRRRHFLTEGRRLVDLEDELFGEGADGLGLGLSGSHVLFAALERSRTGRMRDIVATVQREQDEIIRGPLSGVLVVQGGPGTGKTAVALHRAAYLLYTHRFPLERQGVLVVGPNPLFLRYVEQVLPSLGETGVELSAIGGLFASARPDREASATESAATTRLKGDPRMRTFLSRAVANRQRPLRRELEVPWGRSILRLTPAASNEIVSLARRRRGTHNGRRLLVENLLWRHLHDQLEARLAIGRDENDEDDDDDLAAVYSIDGERIELDRPGGDLSPDELGRQLRRRPVVAEALDRMWPLLSPQQLLHDLFGALALLRLAGRNLLSTQDQDSLSRARSDDVNDVAWSLADIALLDEAAALLGPARRRRPGTDDPDALRSYGHIVVDEAQELSPMQLRMLARRSLSGSMTVVGDIAQGTAAWSPRSWKEVLSYLPSQREARTVELTVNYRTPAEIMDLAAGVLAVAAPGVRPPESVRHSGTGPRFVEASPVAETPGGACALLDAVSQVLAEERDLDGSAAVICPPSLIDAIDHKLADDGIVVGRVGAGALDTRIALLVVEESKGLEFDSVVVVEPAGIVDESTQGLRSLYVALTRATRRLSIVYERPLPGALTE